MKLKKHQRHFVKNSLAFDISVAAWPRQFGASTMLLYYCQYYQDAKISIVSGSKYKFQEKTPVKINQFDKFNAEQLNKVNTEILLIDGLNFLDNIEEVFMYAQQNSIRTIITTSCNQFNELQKYYTDNVYVNLLTYKDTPSIFDLDPISFKIKFDKTKEILGSKEFEKEYNFKQHKCECNSQPKYIKFEDEL